VKAKDEAMKGSVNRVTFLRDIATRNLATATKLDAEAQQQRDAAKKHQSEADELQAHVEGAQARKEPKAAVKPAKGKRK
jgi:hypothetical protein